MNKDKPLSTRGEEASKFIFRIDLKVYGEAIKNLYHKEDNPKGTFPLNVAENKLGWPSLKEKITQLSQENDIPDWVANYTSRRGAPYFRHSLAAFLSRFLTKCPIDPEHIGVTSGATSIIGITAWILAEKGDVAVFPAPAYSTYKQDMLMKAGVERYDVITHHELKSIYNEPALEITQLEKALKDIQSHGKRFRMLVLTNPDNPTGGIYPAEKLLKIADWCVAHKIHLIVNEIYGLSLIDTNHPELKRDYPQSIPFSSFASIMQAKNSDYLHLWYSLSKDLGVSGFRVGLGYSLSEQFFKAFDNINTPHLVSNHTQWIFQLLLNDHRFMEAYIRQNQALLTASYLVVIKQLRELNIPYVPARGTPFVWLDLSIFLKEQTQDAEHQLWEDLYHSAGILLTPGDGFGHSRKGQFRLVYTCLSPEDLVVAMKRFRKYILDKRSKEDLGTLSEEKL